MRNQKCIGKTISEDTGIKSFLDMIAPSVVKFNPDHFICGNTFRCVWALREYPTQTDEQALLRHLGEKDGITLRIYTRQLTPAEEDRIIQNATNKNRMGSSNTNDLRQTVTAESNLQDVASLIASMHRNREPLFHCAVYLELTAPDYDALKLLQTDVLGCIGTILSLPPFPFLMNKVPSLKLQSVILSRNASFTRNPQQYKTRYIAGNTISLYGAFFR